MGFSSIVSQMILFMFILIVVVVLSAAYKDYVSKSNASFLEQQEQMQKRIGTLFEVENYTYSNEDNLTVLIKNTGTYKLDITKIDLYVDAGRISRNDTRIYRSIVGSTNLVNPELFDPNEILEIRYNENLSPGVHVLMISAQDGVVRSFMVEI